MEEIISYQDTKDFVYDSDMGFGMPEVIGTNTKAPVKAVYILQRAEENTAVRVLPSQVMKQLLETTVIDVERSRMEKLLELLDEFFKETPLFLLGCNMDESAVMTAYNAANGG